MKRLLILLLCVVPVFGITNTVFSDIDSDGDLDVYLETILQNDGGMSFTVRNLTTTSGIVSIPGVTRGYFADMTGDGLEDLYIVRAGSKNFLYIRNGPGTFFNATNTSLGANLTGSAVSSAGAAFADFSGDGLVDVFANGQFFVSVPGGFAAINGTNSSNLDELPGLREVVPVDVNLDGLLDFVCVTNAGNICVMLNLGDSNGDGVPEFYDSTRDVQLDLVPSVNTIALENILSGIAVNQSLGYFPFSGVSAPFMVDNFTDMYLGVSGPNQLFVQLFPSAPRAFFSANSSQFYLPRFLNVSQPPVDDSGVSTAVVLADFDNNNFTDVLIGNAAGGSGVYLRNGSSWNQTYLNSSLNASNVTNFKYAAVQDLDGDGFLDIAVIDDQVILDGSVVAGSSGFDVTGPPGASVDPAGDGLSNSDVFASLLLSSQIENIVFSNSNPFSVFIDAVEVFLLPDTGQSLISAGVYSNSFASISGDPGPPVPPVPGVSGGGGGGGYSRLNQYLVVDRVTVDNMGQTYVVDGFKFGDSLKIAGSVDASVRFDGRVLVDNLPAKGRLMKPQQVLVEMGNLKQYAMTDEFGSFSVLFGDLRNLVMGDQDKPLPVWFTPRLAEPPAQRRIGNTYQPYYVENPTLIFISPPPGIGTQYPFSPGVWFNGIPVEPLRAGVPVVEKPAVPPVVSPVEKPIQPAPEVVPEVVPEVPVRKGFFERILDLIKGVVKKIGEFVGVVPEEKPSVKEPTPYRPSIPGVSADCSLSCKNQGDKALFVYSPSSPICPYDFAVPCNAQWTGPTSEVPGVWQPPELVSFIESKRQECCSGQPLGSTTDVTPPHETPPPVPPPGVGVPDEACKIVCLEPGEKGGQSAKYGRVAGGDLACEPTPFYFGCSLPVGDSNYPAGVDIPKAVADECCGVPPPPEVQKCKLICVNGGDVAKYSYKPTGNLDCKPDFTVVCPKPGQELFGPVAPNTHSSDENVAKGLYGACCSLPKGVGSVVNDAPPPPPPAEPPAEELEGCKITCIEPGEVGGKSATYGRVTGGNLACSPTPFSFGCSLPPGDPNYPAGQDLTKEDVAACCSGQIPGIGQGQAQIPGAGADKKIQKKPEKPVKCIEVRAPFCKTPALWKVGGLGRLALRVPAVYAVKVSRVPDPNGNLDCKTPPWEEPAGADDSTAGIDCISFEHCGFATRYTCVDGGGAFRQDSGEVGPQCADGADGDNGGGSTFPCDPCTDQQFFKCGSVVENAYFIGMGGGAMMPVDMPLQAIVGQKNYDECCSADSAVAALYAEECTTSATQSACSYYSNYKGAGLPFFKSNSIATEGSTCADETSATNYQQCSCTDMLYEYGACNSAELNARAALSYEANLVRTTCCPSAFVPGTEPFVPSPVVPGITPPPLTVPAPVPPPNTPPVNVPPPDVPPTITPRPELPIDVTRPIPVKPVENPVTITAPINPNPPPAIDFCVPADASAGVQTEIISNDEAQTILESSDATFPEEYVPQDYDLIESVRVDACQSQQLSFRRSISNVYQDVHVFRCQNGVCSWVSDETQADASCEGESLERIVSGDQTRVLEVAQMGVVTTIGEEITANDRTISTGRYSVEFTGNLPSGVVSLGRPDGRVTLPRNTGLVLVGTPLVITVESAPATARITLPVTPIETATSYSVFGMVGNGWIEVGGTYNADAGIITVDVNNFDTFVKNNKAVFAVMAYTSQATSDSCVMMKEDGNDELIVLVHGFTSNVNTWKPFVTQAYVNKEPYDIVAFQYSPEQTTDDAAKSLMSCLSTVAGNYKRYNVVAHSVGAVITNKALGEMNKNPDAYPTIYTVEKVISLGMPNKGIDVFVMNRLADVLANYPTLATVFDRRSVIAQELVNPEWSELSVAPEWAQHIGVAGTVECDFSQMLTDVTERPVAGGAFSIIDPIQRFARANDCVVTVKNALEHIPNQELCSNTFTPNVWHIALNDDSKVRQLIFYLINQEKAKADPTRGFAGYNQYVSWVDSCSPGAVYGIVGKKATAQKPLFCNCGDGVCDATIGETENSCPIDCFGWNMFACTLLKNLSNLLLVLFGAGFITYFTRKHVMNRQVNEKRWKMALWGTLGTAAAALLIAAMLCPTVPVAGLLLTALLGGLLFAESAISRSPPPSKPAPKPLKGVKAQVSMENEAKANEWERRYEELKRRESVLRKFKV